MILRTAALSIPLRRWTVHALLATLAALLLLTSLPQNGRADPLKLGIITWAPFNGPELPEEGFATDIVRTALARAGYQSTTQWGPWARILKGTQQGVLDVIPGIWYTKERALTLAYSDPIAENRLVYITRQDAPFIIEKMEDLKDLRVGVGRAYAYPEAFLKATHFKRDISESLEINLRKLVSGRIDVTVGDELVARYTLDQLFPKPPSLRYSEHSLEAKPLYMGISRKLPNYREILKRFNKALAEMRADGTYEALKKRHKLHENSPAS